ncbi:hypothetical protein J5X84_39095 [Streptosporangiaceae bacterium NEAU-GS5]|nr:hypothetical protein [Streptosporangiaceae bacterium NEAU-GS5]
MLLTRNAAAPATEQPAEMSDVTASAPAEAELAHVVQTLEEAVLADYMASLNRPGRPLSQRFLADKHGVDRRKVEQIIATVAQPAPGRATR